MRRGTVISFKSCNKILDFIFKNRFMLILCSFFITGFLLAVILNGRYESVCEWSISVLEDFIKIRTDKTFLNIAINSFFSSMLFIIICFAGGTSVLGLVFVPICVGVRGYIYGGMAAVLYSEYLLRGIAFYTVLVLPSAIIFMFAFLFAANEAFNFSLILTKLTLPQTMPMNISFQFRGFCLKYLIICVIIVVSAAVDALLCGNFLMAFNL